jgi:hypothetical protein
LNPLDDDNDNDGMLNSYEALHACLEANTADNLADYEPDGLDNDTEIINLTDPSRGY